METALGIWAYALCSPLERPWSTSSDLEDGKRFCMELKFLGVTGLKAEDLKRAWRRQNEAPAKLVRGCKDSRKEVSEA